MSTETGDDHDWKSVCGTQSDAFDLYTTTFNIWHSKHLSGKFSVHYPLTIHLALARSDKVFYCEI